MIVHKYLKKKYNQIMRKLFILTFCLALCACAGTRTLDGETTKNWVKIVSSKTDNSGNIKDVCFIFDLSFDPGTAYDRVQDQPNSCLDQCCWYSENKTVDLYFNNGFIKDLEEKGTSRRYYPDHVTITMNYASFVNRLSARASSDVISRDGIVKLDFEDLDNPAEILNEDFNKYSEKVYTQEDALRGSDLKHSDRKDINYKTVSMSGVNRDELIAQAQAEYDKDNAHAQDIAEMYSDLTDGEEINSDFNMQVSPFDAEHRELDKSMKEKEKAKKKALKAAKDKEETEEDPENEDEEEVNSEENTKASTSRICSGDKDVMACTITKTPKKEKKNKKKKNYKYITTSKPEDQNLKVAKETPAPKEKATPKKEKAPKDQGKTKNATESKAVTTPKSTTSSKDTTPKGTTTQQDTSTVKSTVAPKDTEKTDKSSDSPKTTASAPKTTSTVAAKDNKNAKAKDTAPKDTKAKDPSAKDVKAKDAAPKDTKAKESSNKDAKVKDSKAKNITKKDKKTKDTKTKDNTKKENKKFSEPMYDVKKPISQKNNVNYSEPLDWERGGKVILKRKLEYERTEAINLLKRFYGTEIDTYLHSIDKTLRKEGEVLFAGDKIWKAKKVGTPVYSISCKVKAKIGVLGLDEKKSPTVKYPVDCGTYTVNLDERTVEAQDGTAKMIVSRNY